MRESRGRGYPQRLKVVARGIIKRRAGEVAFDGDFGGRSLGSGFATSASRAGKTEASIMRRPVAQRAGRAALHSRRPALGR